MTILFVGDVVGRPGRRAVTILLPVLRAEHEPDLVIVNAENAAAGYGITCSTASELLDAGADCLTTGNHVWAQKEALELLSKEHRILRPANYPPGVPGVGYGVFSTPRGGRVGVICLLGRTFMEPADCPFRVATGIVSALVSECEAIVVDFHAEATSEKAALAYYLDGQVSAVIGTHTHVQTADERVLRGGTAFISDCGMTGPLDTIIGVAPEIVVRRFLTGLPARFEVPKAAPSVLSGVVVRTEPGSIKAMAIQRFQVLTERPEKLS